MTARRGDNLPGIEFQIMSGRTIDSILRKKETDAMISKKMENMVANSSAIRAMFEEGNRLAKLYGKENVFDFSLGNPNVPASWRFCRRRTRWRFMATPTAMQDMRM